MKKTARGFTLVEVLITLLIIGVLSGLIYLALRPSEDMVKRKACEGNRSTILLALDAHRFSSGLTKAEYGLQSFIDEGYKNEIDNKETKCPAGGTYSAALSNGREIVVCSVHGGGPTGGGDNGNGGGSTTNNNIPGTNSFGNPGIPPNSTWPTVTDSQGNLIDSVLLPKGTTIAYLKSNGEIGYYVVTNDNGIQVGRNKDAITPEYSWGVGELIEFSDREVISWDDVSNGYVFHRGDIVYYENSFYVLRHATYNARVIYENNHPETSEGKNAWIKLE
ncbi:MAG: competence type IV pilus major pilin ComGC [Synergistaceae bacterium]